MPPAVCPPALLHLRPGLSRALGDRGTHAPQAEEASAGSEAAARKERMKERTPREDWTALRKRTFDFDVFACVRYGGRRRVLAHVK